MFVVMILFSRMKVNITLLGAAMHEKDPLTMEAFLDENGLTPLAEMSDNEDVLKAHPEENVIGPQSDKSAEFGMDLSSDN